MSLQRGIDLHALAEKMGQCSGAEVRGICTEAGALSIFFDEVSLTNNLFRHVRPSRTTTTRYPRGLRICCGKGPSVLPRFLRLKLIVFLPPGLEKESRGQYFS